MKKETYKTILEIGGTAINAAFSILAIIVLGLLVRGLWDGFMLGFTVFGYSP